MFITTFEPLHSFIAPAPDVARVRSCADQAARNTAGSRRGRVTAPLKALIFAVIFCPPLVVQATVMSGDDTVFGVDSLTIDSDQGLAFLDVTQSLNRSFADVSTQFGAGGDFEGFRYATRAELVALVNNFGFSPGAVLGAITSGDTGADQVSELVSLLGQTASFTIGDNTRWITNGITGDLNFINNPFEFRILDLCAGAVGCMDAPGDNDQIQAGLNVRSSTQSASTFGSFLVKTATPVPAPTTVTLLTVALLSLGLRRRRGATRAA